MDLEQWKPFREVTRLRREMDRLWDEYFGPGRRAFQPMEEAWMPAIDVSETGEKITVSFKAPEISPTEKIGAFVGGFALDE